MEKNLGEFTTRKKEKEGYSYVLPCSKAKKNPTYVLNYTEIYSCM